MKRVHSLTIIFIIIIFSTGCTTSKTKKMVKDYSVNFVNGGKIAFMPGDTDISSRQLANGLEKKYLEKERFEVILDSSISNQFSSYPLMIFNDKLAHNVFIGEKGEKTVRALGRKLNVDYICFSSVIVQGDGGGILLYDLKDDKIVTSFYFEFNFTQPDGLTFTNDYEYTQKQMEKCIDYIDRKLQKML